MMRTSRRVLPRMIAIHAHFGKRRARPRTGGQLRNVEPINSGLPRRREGEMISSDHFY